MQVGGAGSGSILGWSRPLTPRWVSATFSGVRKRPGDGGTLQFAICDSVQHKYVPQRQNRVPNTMQEHTSTRQYSTTLATQIYISLCVYCWEKRKGAHCAKDVWRGVHNATHSARQCKYRKYCTKYDARAPQYTLVHYYPSNTNLHFIGAIATLLLRGEERSQLIRIIMIIQIYCKYTHTQ